MTSKEDEFLKKLLVTFKIEADEHIKVISSGLFNLEKEKSQNVKGKIIETILREAHSLKGAARAVNIGDIELICQSIESLFSALKRSEITITPGLIDLLHQSMDYLNKILGDVSSVSHELVDNQNSEQVEELNKMLQSFLKPGDKDLKKPLLKGTPAKMKQQKRNEELLVDNIAANEILSIQSNNISSETIKVPVKKMDLIMLQAEELLPIQLAMNQRVADLQAINSTLIEFRNEQTKISSELKTLERDNKILDNIVKKKSTVEKILGSLNKNDNYLKELEQSFTTLCNSSKLDSHSFKMVSDSLLDDMKKVLMLPLTSVVEILPKIVRELSKDQKKEVELIMNGTDIEIDRKILEEIKDPLIHLIRNCIDHGIEKPEERKRNNKSPKGLIKISAAQKDGAKFEILVADDGAGINFEKVKASALKLKLVSEEEAGKISQEQILELIFQSGISASPLVTNISGRGLGLAIVNEKIEKLGGSVTVETENNVGTTFRIVLPLTLAAFRGVLVGLGENVFVIPTSQIEHVAKVKRGAVKTVENKETIYLRGEVLSLISLADVLEINQNGNGRDKQNDELQIIVVNNVNNKIAFSVDEVIGENEVLIKTLGKQFPSEKYISGVTVLGNGKVLPVINVFEIMKSAAKKSIPIVSAEKTGKELLKKKSILLAEDSITTRTLLKNILEGAGYEVTTAVDGIDAFTKLRTANFNIVCSDVDMPRMGGFDLVTKIRSEKKFSDLPIVLITALESKEDRERGIDVGASAYILKSSFDQSHLLDVIRQLI